MSHLLAINDPFTILTVQGREATIDLSCLKRETLMFSRILIPALRASFFSNNDIYSQNKAALTELEGLLDMGVVREPPNWNDKKGLGPQIETFVSMLIRMKFGEPGIETLHKKDFTKTMMALAAVSARTHSIMLRDEGFTESYAVIATPALPKSESESKSVVLDIVMNALPVPDDMTPWEQIFEYRSDPDSQSKFYALKNWINDVARMKLPYNEVEDKLRSLISDYENHMKIHRIKTKLDALKTIVVAEAGFIGGGWLAGLEALTGLAGIIATPLFTMKQRQIALMEEEQKAPGKEIAYIVKTNETFG